MIAQSLNGTLGIGAYGSTVKLVQIALRAAGAELSDDSDFGPITQSAVKSFQETHGLLPTGIVDMETAIALDDAFAKASVPGALPSVKAVAPWLSVMRSITGTKEFPGGADNPIILGWVKEIVAAYPDLAGTVGWYDHDSIPWCGLGMALCMTRAGKKPPKMALGAGNWFTDWPDGHRLPAPCLGAVVVKSRVGGHHVFLYEGENDAYFYARGCNQSDAVNVSMILKDQSILGFMWPNGDPQPQGGRIYTSFANAKQGSEA